MEQKEPFKCTGDCLRCSIAQRQYCASQFTYNSMRMVEQLALAVEALQNTVDDVKTRLETMQGSEATIFRPSAEAPAQPIAQ